MASLKLGLNYESYQLSIRQIEGLDEKINKLLEELGDKVS
jgi:hypothetical protein